MKFFCQFGAKLVSQNVGFDLFNITGFQVTQHEGAEGEANEAVDVEAQMSGDAFDLAVFAFS